MEPIFPTLIEDKQDFSLSRVIQNKSGQSSIEFLFAFIFSLSFFISFLFITINYVSGYLVHYATFMAARAYLVADSGGNDPSYVYSDAENYAKKTFARYHVQDFYISNVNMVINPPTFGGLGGSSRRAKLFVGPYTTFNQVFIVNLFAPRRSMRMISESFLGKEITRADCLKRMCQLLELKAGYSCNSAIAHATLFDNGC